MLKDQAIAGQQSVQHRLPVILIAAPQDMVMGAGNNLNAVQLHKAEFADDIHQIQRTGRRRLKPL